MKLRNVFSMMVCAAIVAMTALSSSAFAAGNVTCPNGTRKAGNTVSTMAECNIEDDDSLIPTVQVIIDVIIGVLGLAAVVVIVLGGVTYVTSQGDPTKVKKAKDTILYGIIGLVVAILAYAIVNFVLSSIFS